MKRTGTKNMKTHKAVLEKVELCVGIMMITIIITIIIITIIMHRNKGRVTKKTDFKKKNNNTNLTSRKT